MKKKHIFVPFLDIEEILPFAVKKQKSLGTNFKTQEEAKKELVRFVELLEKNFKESLYYMGMDVIGEKSYERFIFQKGGFFEVMTEEPLALNAHFISEKRAGSFLKSLKKTLKSVVGSNKSASLMIDTIQVQNEEDTSLSVERWNKMKDIRNIK